MNLSRRLRTCAKHTGLDAVIELLQEAADEIDALQARAQVHGEPVNLQHMAVAENGALRWMTGRKVQNCELYAMPDFGRAPTLYTTPQPAQATQAEVTDSEIVAVMRDGNNCNYNDEAEHIQFARAILALRPDRVPMTDEALWTSVIEHLGPEALSGGRMSILGAFHLGITVAEAHHGITDQAKNEQA